MGVNRFTQFNPAAMQQTYEPFPFEKMFAMAQYQRNRDDNVTGVLDKVRSEMHVEPGLATPDDARMVNADRDAAVADITSRYRSGELDYSGVTDAIWKMRQGWENDNRAKFVKSDFNMKNAILAETLKEGYGTTDAYGIHNPDAHTWTIPDKEAIIKAGGMVTGDMYNRLSTKGAPIAYKTFLDPIKADAITNHGYVEDPDTGQLIATVTTKDSSLDLTQIGRKVKPALEQLSSDPYGHGRLDQAGGADGELQKHIAMRQYQERIQGREFTYSDLKKELMAEASKMIKLNTSETSTSPKTPKSGGGGVGGDGGLFGGGARTGPIMPSAVTDSEIGGSSSPSIAAADLTGMNPYDEPDTPINKKTGLPETTRNGVNHSNIFAFSAAEQQDVLEKTIESFTTELMNSRSEIPVPGGTAYTMTIDQVNQEARKRGEAHFARQKKVAAAYRDASIEAVEAGITVPVLDENGKFKNQGTGRWGEVEKDLNTIVANTSADKETMDEVNNRIDRSDLPRAVKIAMKTMSFSSVADFNASVVKKVRSIWQGTGDILGLRAHDKFMDIYDQQLATKFGASEFAPLMYPLFSTEDTETVSKDQLASHRALITAAKDIAENGSGGIYYNNVRLNAPNEEGEDGMTRHKLFTQDGGTDYFIGHQYHAEEYRYDQDHNKVFVSGKYKKKNQSFDKTKPESADNPFYVESNLYEIDVTETAFSTMSYDQVRALHIMDAIQTSMETIGKGMITSVPLFEPDNVLEAMDDLVIKKNMDNTWAIHRGKTNTPNGKVAEISDILRDPDKYGINRPPENPDRLSRGQLMSHIMDVTYSRSGDPDEMARRTEAATGERRSRKGDDIPTDWRT